MHRTVEVNRRDICPGDIPRTAEYELDDNMPIPQFLQFIAEATPYNLPDLTNELNSVQILTA